HTRSTRDWSSDVCSSDLVDQPPFTPAVARAAHDLFGDSLLALRFLPALAGGVAVIVTALIARELGAGGVGQALAALCTATTGTRSEERRVGKGAGRRWTR